MGFVIIAINFSGGLPTTLVPSHDTPGEEIDSVPKKADGDARAHQAQVGHPAFELFVVWSVMGR